MSDLVEDGWKTLNEAWKFSKRTVLSTPEMEVKVEEATSNEEWGPSSSQLTEIAGSSFRYSDLPLIMGTLYRRIQDNGKNWRHVYKSLVVMDYLLKHGSDDSIRSMRAHSLEIQQLTHFHHIDEHKDVGQAVRSKAKAVLELIHDESKLREERDKAKKNRGKYQGYGSDTPGYRGGGGGRDYDEEYDRSPYENRRNQETPSPSTYRRKPPTTRDLSDSDSSDDDDEYETAKRAPSAGARGGRPRAPSDERDRAKPIQPPAPAAPSSRSLLFELEEPTPSTLPSPFFPPPSGGSSGGSTFGGGLFEPFGPSSGGAFPPSSGGSGLPLSGGGAVFTSFSTSPAPTNPVRPPVQEEEWDGFQSFETPKDQKDIWYQHKSLFDLQHLNLADQKNAPPKQEEKKPLGAMLAEKQKNKPGPTLGNPATFAPFGPSVTTTPVPKPGPVLGQPVIPSMGQPGLTYPGAQMVGAGMVGAPMVGYPAGYPYAPAVPGYGGIPFAQGGLTPSYPSTAYKSATSGAK